MPRDPLPSTIRIPHHGRSRTCFRGARRLLAIPFLAAVLIVVIACDVAAQAFTVGTRLDFGTGTQPISVAIGDLNGDGKLDLVAANSGSNTVSVLLGNGAGAFGAKTDFATGSAPYSVAIGDVNNDGIPDLVVANSGSNTVSVLFGNGAGGFGAKTDFATGTGPRSVTIGDVSGDGRPDLVVANFGSNTVSVLLGNGAGGFGAKTDFATGTQPFSVAIGDVNGDGKADLVLANFGSNTVSVLLGDGAGGFGAKTDFATGTGPYSVAIGDVSGDARPDLAVANSGSNTVSVLLGDGAGGFGAKTDYATGTSAQSVAIGDVNGDSKPDLVLANTNSNTVSVLLGNGDGTFAAKNDFATGTTPACIAIADVNGDGKPDLAVGYGAVSSNTISVLLGNGAGGFAARTDFATGNDPVYVAIGDVNRDGRPDLAVTNGVSNTVSVLLGNGAGGFGAKADFPTGSGPFAVAIGDVNADGKPDLVVANSGPNTVSVMLGDGAGGFGAKTDFATGTHPTSVAIADVNRDGKPDLVVANSGANTVSVLLGNGAGGFGTKTDFATGTSPFSLAIGDLNGDGKLDLATTNATANTVSVLLGNGDGSFAANTDFATGTNPHSVAISDLNSDGKPDLAVANLGSNTVSVLLGNGAGSFGAKTDFATGSTPYSVAVGDLNGDGKPDLAVANQGSSTVSVLLGNGAGAFGGKTDFVTALGPGSVAIGDLNGDGRLDLALANSTFNNVSVLLALETTRAVLTANPILCVLGSPLTLTASVTVAAPGSGSPTGTVSFFDGNTLLGTSPVNGAGQAGLALFAPYLGSRTLSAVYGGDSKLLGSIAASKTEMVTPTATPAITSIADVLNDQGRQVRLEFSRSPFDYVGGSVTGYQIYRRAIISGATSRRAPVAPSGIGPARSSSPDQVLLAGWDYVVTVPATGEDILQTLVPTLADSNSSGFHRAVLFVRAATATPTTFYDSAPDSGYSVDNLPPAAPAPFTAAYVSGGTHLHWGQNLEPDFWYYKVYRGGSAGFIPSAANQIASQSDTGYVDVGPAGSYYKLSAVDVNGNESAYSLVTPAGTLDAGGTTLPTMVFLAAPSPNPSARGTLLRFGLPRDAVVSLGIYDVRGRLVRELVSGPQSAGEQQLTWDLRGPSGAAVSDGIYFVQLGVNGIKYSRRIAVIR